MATIKTQTAGGERKIITKLVGEQRKVSCSCCVATECCVYPASCGMGPSSVEHYGTTISGDGTTFGDTTNGVILESGAWAVYRNGVRSTKSCLGLALPTGSADVAATLATTYSLDVDGPGIDITSSLAYDGAIAADTADESVVGNVTGQCFWTGASGTQDFDEGFVLFFNPNNCRWEITSGPINFVYAYLAAGSPVGSYTSNTTETWTVY